MFGLIMPNPKGRPKSHTGSTPQKKKQKMSFNSSDCQVSDLSNKSKNSGEIFTPPATGMSTQSSPNLQPSAPPADSSAGRPSPGASSAATMQSHMAQPHDSINSISNEAPAWFKAFEARQELRFAALISEVRDQMQSEISSLESRLQEEIKKLKCDLKKTDEKEYGFTRHQQNPIAFLQTIPGFH